MVRNKFHDTCGFTSLRNCLDTIVVRCDLELVTYRERGLTIKWSDTVHNYQDPLGGGRITQR